MTEPDREFDGADRAFARSFEKPSPGEPYLPDVIRWLDSFEPGLWERLDRVPALPTHQGEEILAGFLDLACRSQNARNIHIGRYTLAALPRAWTLARIEAAAEPLLATGDDWEWRRLLEVASALDRGLTRRLAARARAAESDEIREAGRDFGG